MKSDTKKGKPLISRQVKAGAHYASGNNTSDPSTKTVLLIDASGPRLYGVIKYYSTPEAATAYAAMHLRGLLRDGLGKIKSVDLVMYCYPCALNYDEALEALADHRAFAARRGLEFDCFGPGAAYFKQAETPAALAGVIPVPGYAEVVAL